LAGALRLVPWAQDGCARRRLRQIYKSENTHSVVSQKQGARFITQPKLIEALSRGQHGKIATEQPSTNQSRAPSAHSRAKSQLIEVPLS
jgi:hypothetical protein